jgi:acyl-CoA hydrolase
VTEIAPINRILSYLSPGRTVYVPGTSVESLALIEFLKTRSQASRGVRFISMLIPGINSFDYTSLHPEARFVAFFPFPQIRQSILNGRTELMPHSYYGAYKYIEKSIDIDVAIVHVSPPDSSGNCSLGLAADFSAMALARATFKVALVNRAMPVTCGDTTLPAAGFDALIRADGRLVTTKTSPPRKSNLQVGANVATLIKDGDSLQLGLGSLQSAVLPALKSRRNLRICSGMITQAVMDLDQMGALAADDGAITTGVAIGGPAFVDWVRENPSVHFKPVEMTHGPDVGQDHHRFVAVNSAIEVDLLGQVNGEAANGQLISSSGGLTDFMRATARHPNGCSIIALPSTSEKGKVSRIVATLTPGTPVSIRKSDPLIVVTDHGVADLRPLGLDQRAAALIAIAAPLHRKRLEREWNSLRSQFLGSTL